ncbi:hypothetical protein [Treponema sp. R80B11-R83G3]
MKKIAGKIAMILVLVMLANSFSSCAEFWRGTSLEDFGRIVDNTLLILCGIAVIVIFLWGGFAEAEPPNETGIYLASAEHNNLTDYNSVMEIINSLPETERNSLTEKINSLPKEKRAFLVKTIKALPQTEVASSIKKLNALSKKELISAVRSFNNLSEVEFDSLANKLNDRAKSSQKTEYADVVAFSNQKASMALCFQY